MANVRNRPSAEVRLKRFLYTSTEEPKYITGNPELHSAYTPEKVKSVSEILQSQNPELLLNIIEIVNSDKLVPRTETIFFILATAAASTTSDVLKHKIFTTLLNIIKSSEDLCMFIKFYTKQKQHFASAVNKVISSYYMKKDPLELAAEVGATKGYHSWTHKDLVKLAHCRSESIPTAVVIHYILYGLERAKAVAEENPSAAPIIEKLTKSQELKRCENENRIAELITDLKCDTLIQVPSFYHRSQAIWEALLPNLPLSELLTCLPRLYKYGFLKANTTLLSMVTDCLTKAEAVQESSIHPIEVFIGLRNFEKGGKPLDPKFLTYLKKMEEEKKDDPNFKKIEQNRDPPKCPALSSALHKALQLSYQNLQATGRKFMVTVDMSEKMVGHCMNSRNLSCMDAAVILALSLLKAERDVTVAVFNDSQITIVPVERNINFNQALAKLKQAKSGYVFTSSPFNWAANKKKQVDVFINVLYYHHWNHHLPKELTEKEKPLEALNKYRKKMSLPHTKLISFSLSSPKVTVADGSHNVLEICGFSKEVPKVVEAFSKGLFY